MTALAAWIAIGLLGLAVWGTAAVDSRRVLKHTRDTVRTVPTAKTVMLLAQTGLLLDALGLTMVAVNVVIAVWALTRWQVEHIGWALFGSPVLLVIYGTVKLISRRRIYKSLQEAEVTDA